MYIFENLFILCIEGVIYDVQSTAATENGVRSFQKKKKLFFTVRGEEMW